MKILVTGFDPFGGEATNPAWEAVRHLPDTVDGARDHQGRRSRPCSAMCRGRRATRSSSTTPM